MIRGRYAPSPTGAQHLGNARTALLAWLQIRALGGEFILRIEDLDPHRSRAYFEALIVTDLGWLGLDWDQGPGAAGPDGPYRQSERHHHYESALARLQSFACVCTRRELRQAALAPWGREPIYPGTCRGRGLPPEGAARRWCTPRGSVRVTDRLCGELESDVAREVGDFVLRRADGAFAYQLAVVVDDGLMGITHVLRGADLWPSTPRQVLLQRALGLSTPAYTHVPLLWAEGGDKLSKRQRAPTLESLREAGVDPGEVVADLARSVNLVGPGIRRVAPSELIEAFAASELAPGPSPSA